MIILHLFYWIAAYSTGLIGFTALILTARHDRSRMIRSLLLLFLSLGLIILAATSAYLVDALTLPGASPTASVRPIFESAVNMFFMTGVGLFSVALPRFFQSTGVMAPTPIQRRLLLIAAAVTTLGSLTARAAFHAGAPVLVLFIPQLALLTLASASALWCFIRGTFFPVNRNAPGYAYLRILSAGGIIFFLGIYFRDILFSFIAGGVDQNYFIFLPGFSIFFNIFFLLFLAQRRRHTAAAPAEGSKERFGITPREAEVIEKLLQGRSYKEIAAELSIALPTVQSHVTRIYRKTGARNKVELGNLLH